MNGEHGVDISPQHIDEAAKVNQEAREAFGCQQATSTKSSTSTKSRACITSQEVTRAWKGPGSKGRQWTQHSMATMQMVAEEKAKMVAKQKAEKEAKEKAEKEAKEKQQGGNVQPGNVQPGNVQTGKGQRRSLLPGKGGRANVQPGNVQGGQVQQPKAQLPDVQPGNVHPSAFPPEVLIKVEQAMMSLLATACQIINSDTSQVG